MNKSVRSEYLPLGNVMRNVELQIPPPISFYSSSSSSSTTSSSSSSSLDSETDQWKHERRPLPRMRRKPIDYNKKCPQFPPRKRFVALDCEMVGVGANSSRSSLARVVIVDWRGQSLFDEYIQQSEYVTDYRTFVSGITEQNLQQATMTLHTCRIMVSKILFGQILVGHGLENDLRALGIDHPWWMIRDTACYEPFMSARNNSFLARKLKDLVYERLGKQIQEIGKPHSPHEDARWAMNLYKTVRSDWESCIQFMVQRSQIEFSIERLHIQCASRSPYTLQQPVY